ncbi:MAG: peptidoglycan-associated lipoprotein Pal [Halieaceae bacterium]|jgi:peptidoglycan-associated lipoprotein|nr:peptidoglycan-associated lipoprotein Pal [Halieaceae bacterium]
MKQVTVAGKALSVIFAVLWMVGCASTDTSEADAQAEAEAAARAEQMAAEEARQAEQMRKMKMLEDAVSAAGNVVYFEFDKSTLNAATRRVLDAHIALLKTNSETVRLEGHADERGTREYNMALGERRAKAVLDYMAVNGIGRGRIETVSYGEERPAVAGSGPAAWSKNRRVEIK